MALTEAVPTPAKPRVGRVADPCAMVIFGVTGDLTRRKLIPSLYNLASEQFYARVAWSRWTPSTDEARKKLEELNRLSA